MDELISREAVKEMLKDHRVDFSTEKDYRTARACANAVPPAEPKIIRCKDCKHYKYGMCMKICANKSTNGFCDWGERGTE